MWYVVEISYAGSSGGSGLLRASISPILHELFVFNEGSFTANEGDIYSTHRIDPERALSTLQALRCFWNNRSYPASNPPTVYLSSAIWPDAEISSTIRPKRQDPIISIAGLQTWIGWCAAFDYFPPFFVVPFKKYRQPFVSVQQLSDHPLHRRPS